ncbi:unnamed protein product [Cylicocyclus nassatus]|uniref:Uncharacterized protein n=1 Tax=Cylicocyclus nassatus TaxID=53992 RepID=A0AA36HAJ0_CYLNA|nr:unnamed protein product [Cylicocyclus nassatus]
MAFYFALLNVSAKREDRPNPPPLHKQKRRRHSIASVESPVLDYRLLPRPQVVRNQFYRDDQPDDDQNDDGRQQQRQNRTSHNPEQNRSASSSRQNAATTSQTTRDHTSRKGGGSRSAKERPQSRSAKNAEAASGAGKKLKVRQNSEGAVLHERRERQQRLAEQAALKREFEEMQVATSSRREQPEREPVYKIRMNGSTERAPAKVVETPSKPPAKQEYNWRAKRPIVVKRRVSPQESSTSDSRRSSNQSNNRSPMNDSLASTNSSRRTSEAVQPAPVPSPCSPCHIEVEPHKVSNISMPSKLSDIPRSATLKKVTFENDNSEYVVSSAFLGDRRVLVRRGSGSAVLRRSIAQQLSPSTVPTTTLLPFAQGTAALAGLAYGAALWAPFSGEKEVTPDRQNVTNDAIEETSRRSRSRGLLRRRSTSDRQVVYGFQNQGFRFVDDGTPQCEIARTPSGATLVPFAG